MTLVFDSGEFNKKQQSSTFQYYYRMTVDLNSQDLVNRTSNLTFKLVMYCKSSGTTKWTGVANAYAPYGYIDTWTGSAWQSLVQGQYINSYTTSTTELVIATYTGDFQHDANGDLQIQFKYGWNTGSGSTAQYRPASWSYEDNTTGIPSITAVMKIKLVGSNIVNLTSQNVVVGKYISNTGQILDAPSNFYCDEFFPAKPNTKYNVEASQVINYYNVMEYDSSQNFIKRNQYQSISETTLITDPTTAYICIGANMTGTPLNDASEVLAVTWSVYESPAWHNGRVYEKTGASTWSPATKVKIKTSDGWKDSIY